MKKSIKSELIKIVANEYCLQNVWRNVSDIEIPLQEELKKYFSFGTKVFNGKTDNNDYYVDILFVDEYNKNRVINITVENINIT